jgi:ATP-dependent Clp protease ATP-binding subunit ClpA
MKSATKQQLDPSRRSNAACEFEASLRSKIVGQNSAVESFVEVYQVFLAGLNPSGRPISNLLFLGPTGTGKTKVFEAVGEILFGDPRAMIKIDCAEFQHSHEIAKLIGSPPGYLGHRETHPLLTQEALNAHHTDTLKISLLLFDEIEKASDALWQLLLGMLDKATLTLGDNRRVDLSQCVIGMTSNLGSSDMIEIQEGSNMGFTSGRAVVNERYDARINDSALNAARRKFTPEFMNRIDKTVVFNTLREEHLRQILDIELGGLQQRVHAGSTVNDFDFDCSAPVKDQLLAEGTDMKYGARHLKRVIERRLTYPLSNLLATGQIIVGDMVRVDVDGDRFTFTKEPNAKRKYILETYSSAPVVNPSSVNSASASAVAAAAVKRRKIDTDKDGPNTVF